MLFLRSLLCAFLFLAALSAQQPFYTDDADVTDRGHFHFELSNQHSFTQPSAFPNRRQNAVVYQLNYGLWKGLELGVDSPYLVVWNAPNEFVPRRPTGVGDTNFTLKWNFRPEQEGSSWPALTVSFAVESTTGDTRTQLGSGLADYGLNGVLQKSLTDRTTLRINQGVLFSGNTLTGVVGLRAQGFVYTGGASITRQFTSRLLLGVESNGAVAQSGQLGKAALQGQVGGKYVISETMTLDFGVAFGALGNSPRVGLQLGISKDF